MLKGKEKRQLRAQANHIKASVFIGKEGVTEKLYRFIDEALGNKELVKVKVQESKAEEFDSIVDLLAKIEDIEIVQILGRTILLFRPLPETEDHS
jgi:RNA-binding protein